MKTFKGTDENMKCRGFQYELGKEFETKEAEMCDSGFHACEYPLDVFNYYSPTGSRYFETDLDANEQTSSDSKRVGSKIKFTAEIGIPGLVKAAVEYIKERVNWEDVAATNTGNRSAATNTGYQSAATNTGDYSAATVTGKESIAIAIGVESKAKASLDSYIVLAEWVEEDNGDLHLKNVKSAKIDGKILKPNIFYHLVDGEFIKLVEEE